ncbi:hypothetical protein DFQ28_008141 [Apophysomyces sp. BC1034]|nr:hypothetical protein DFQ30_007855 [Apophysomyces sp. BC1015]KAG0175905.1 hypothetical protein DFQ29_006817 [Apophysomyces sp. BC1021]KAG0186242.1 hypothetical protein DFQ28_008141 [Apophysomyces sp. BC1034]
MSTVLSDPVSEDNQDQSCSYKEIIKQLAAQAPQPYGAIPKRRQKRRRRQQQKEASVAKGTNPLRHMSHVENWVAVDSKESLPDEEELEHLSPFQNFLSAGFLTQVLPLHMPPPSLSDPAEQSTLSRLLEHRDAMNINKRTYTSGEEDEDPSFDLSAQLADETLEDYEGDDDDEDDEEDEDDNDEDDDDDDNDNDNDNDDDLIPENKKKTICSDSSGSDNNSNHHHRDSQQSAHAMVRQRSIPSFSKSQTPSTSTTTSCVLSSSPPHHYDAHRVKWLQTIAHLRRSLTISSAKTSKLNRKLIPMPPPPRLRRSSRRRRSEATTQPRFNPETDTYTRDTRSNPDHLRMISAELNMMRARKLFSPLKPRGFLPRRRDPFVRGAGQRVSSLRYQL